jgi:transposase InsO family protein
MSQRYQRIEQLSAQHAVSVLCGLLGVARSGYYAWRQRTPCRRQQEDARLGERISQLFQASRGTYGRPRLVAALRTYGLRHSGRRVARLMRQQGLCARIKRRFVPRTTDSRHDEPIAPNRLPAYQRQRLQPDQVWVADLTYLKTAEGWLYLAVVLDLASRRVVGWAFGLDLRATLPLAALRMALAQRRPPRGLLHHSDRGIQYASSDYRAELARHGVEASMSRSGNPYDNAACESFMSTLKVELVHRLGVCDRVQTQAAVFDYVETFYNRARLHSALGYRSPSDFENQVTTPTN